MLRSLFVFCLVCFTASALAQEYQSKELADAALDWRQELIDSVPANKKQPNLSAALRRTAEIEYQAKDYTAASSLWARRSQTRPSSAPLAMALVNLPIAAV